MKLIENSMPMVLALCQKRKVIGWFVFGSILTDNINSESDIDFIVKFNKNEIIDYFDNYFDFKYALEELFDREIDLVEEQAIRNPYFKETIDSTKTLIYG